MNCWVEIFSPRMDSFALVKQIFKGYWIVCAVRCTWSLSCIWLCDPADCSLPGSSVHSHSPGKNTGVGCHALLQGIFPTQDRTQVSRIAGRFSTSWATREAQECWSGEPVSSPADVLDPGIKLGSPALQANSLPAKLPGKPTEIFNQHCYLILSHFWKQA